MPTSTDRTVVDVDFYRVIVRAPVTFLKTGPRTGWTVAAPPEGSFDPAAVRITAAPDIRPGDIVLGTIQHHYGPLLEVLDRLQSVSYFAGVQKPQVHGARPWEPGHCRLCSHHHDLGLAPVGGGWVTVDGCTLYSPDSLLLVVPRELAGVVKEGPS
jgi:hypothetical protein